MNYVLLAGKVKTKEDERFSLEVSNFITGVPDLIFCKARNGILRNVASGESIVVEGKIVASDRIPSLKIVEVEKLIDLKAK